MSTATYKPIKVADSGTEEWWKCRAFGIGASEAADALGLSKYGERWKLYHKKIGTLKEDSDNNHTWFGNKLESVIVEFWEKENGQKVLQHPCPMYRHPDYPFILATPDAIISETKGLEIKHMGWWVASEMGDEGSDYIPERYVVQAQQQMLVMGWDEVEFAILVEKSLKKYTVKRNEDLIEAIIDGLTELWERIQNYDEPEPDWENDSVPETVKQLFKKVDSETFDLSPLSGEAWSEYEEIGKQLKKLEKRRAELKARVLKEIGNREAGILPGGERMVRRKEIPGTTFTVDRKPRIDVRAVKVKGDKS